MKAFSLVELAIVLVIVGLMVGGVMAGKSLIRASELRSVTVDYERYVGAFVAFTDQYNALPGDMKNAITIWGKQAGGDLNGTDSACANQTAIPTGMLTCNGNGDGMIAGTGATVYESYRAWQHLGNAALITGGYSGVTNGSANTLSVAVGTNVPKSRMSGNAGFSVRTYPVVTSTGDATYFPGAYGNVLVFGAAAVGAANTDGASLLGEDAWNIDLKVDDGEPQYGKVLAPKMSGCVTSTNPDSATYAVTGSTPVCSLIMRIGL